MEGLKKGILVRNGTAVGALGDKYFSNAPIGVIQAFSGNTVPHGYLLCNGTSYKVADYPDLYAVIGNTYGGDTENFNVPNLVDKFVQGSTTSGTEKEAGLPNITGGFYSYSYFNGTPSGAITTSVENRNQSQPGGDNMRTYIHYSLDASRSSSVYGKSTTVQPPALTMVYIIKAFHTNEGVDSGVSDDVINYVNNSNSYSTEETLTGGKWIDGKPIYRKVYKVTNITTNIDLSELNIADIITININLKQINNDITAFPYAPNNQDNYNNYIKTGYYKATTKEWIWQFGSTATANFTSGIFIIEYTKTTD